MYCYLWIVCARGVIPPLRPPPGILSPPLLFSSLPLSSIRLLSPHLPYLHSLPQSGPKGSGERCEHPKREAEPQHFWLILSPEIVSGCNGFGSFLCWVIPMEAKSYYTWYAVPCTLNSKTVIQLNIHNWDVYYPMTTVLKKINACKSPQCHENVPRWEYSYADSTHSFLLEQVGKVCYHNKKTVKFENGALKFKLSNTGN